MSARDPFKVYDARWEVHEFDDDAIVRMFHATYTYGKRLNVDTVTLARDGRLAAGQVLDLAAETALRMGLRVLLCPEPISTPQAYYLALRSSCTYPNTMGLMVTASHNPAQYIGVKFTVPVVQAIGRDCGPLGGLTAIREIYHGSERFGAVGGGSLQLVSVGREYIDFSMRAAGVAPGELSGMSVVLDGFHGSAGPEIMTALQSAGVEVHSRRLIPDGRFPTGSPNPTSQSKMDAAVALTRERNCTATIGLDGDGDRVVFGDRRGILSAGFAAIPILRACVAGPARSGESSGRNHVLALYDAKVNPLALREWGNLNVRPVLFRNGHSQIKDYMMRVGALAAAEESGHYYHRVTMGDLAVCCENTILTILLFLGALKRGPRLLDELWTMQNAICTTGEFNYQFGDDATRDRALYAVIQRLTSRGAKIATATRDGINLEGTVVSSGVHIDDHGVHLQSGWYAGCVRISTNEKSVVRCYFSSADPERLSELETATRRMLAEDFQGRIID